MKRKYLAEIDVAYNELFNFSFNIKMHMEFNLKMRTVLTMFHNDSLVGLLWYISKFIFTKILVKEFDPLSLAS